METVTKKNASNKKKIVYKNLELRGSSFVKK